MFEIFFKWETDIRHCFKLTNLQKCVSLEASYIVMCTQNLNECFMDMAYYSLMDYMYNSQTSRTLLKKVLRCLIPFSIYCLLQSFTIPSETWTIKHQQIAKSNDQLPKERLSTSMLHVYQIFLDIYPNDPIFRFQEEAIGYDLTFMQSKIKSKGRMIIAVNCPI